MRHQFDNAADELLDEEPVALEERPHVSTEREDDCRIASDSNRVRDAGDARDLNVSRSVGPCRGKPRQSFSNRRIT
jgi:hypothetical protein